MKRVVLSVVLVLSFISVYAQIKPTIAQFTVVPGLSTNGKNASIVVNRVSINLLGGYNGGLDGIELGGLVNVLRNDMRGIQLAGLSNVVMGKIDGVQVSGLVNISNSSVLGWQLGGFLNLSESKVYGAQMSGIFNSSETIKGLQLSGVINSTKQLNGTQISGITNIADKANGLQLVGLFNYANSIEGTQIGLINSASLLKGSQLGLINIVDSLQNGVPIGFISFVENGYKTVDLYANEVLPANISLKTGVDAFYNIFSAGTNFNADDLLWSFGYGVGSRFHMSKHTLMEFEVSVSHISEGKFTEDLNLLSRFQWNFTYQFGRFAEVYLGPSVNLYFSQVYNLEGLSLGSDIAHNPFYEDVIYDWDQPTLVQAWIGGQIGVRIF